jgi:membrane associated rhomboid family serine protease
MDWSLVLISQGIGAEIQPANSEDSTWGLLVSAQDYQNAVAAIRQYRIENRGWWQREIFRPGLIFDWGSLAWIILLVLFFWLDARIGLRAAGVMDATAVAHGQWWRVFTSIWLHADLAHLAANAALGLVVLGLTMGQIGTGPGLLAAYLAGAGGNVIALGLSARTVTSLGASGMVMGCVGILASHSLALQRGTRFSKRHLVVGHSAGLMLFVLLGLSPGTYVQAHLGGFASGLVLGTLLIFLGGLAGKTLVNLGCGLIFTLLVLVPWWMALSK